MFSGLSTIKLSMLCSFKCRAVLLIWLVAGRETTVLAEVVNVDYSPYLSVSLSFLFLSLSLSLLKQFLTKFHFNVSSSVNICLLREVIK